MIKYRDSRHNLTNYNWNKSQRKDNSKSTKQDNKIRIMKRISNTTWEAVPEILTIKAERDIRDMLSQQ